MRGEFVLAKKIAVVVTTVATLLSGVVVGQANAAALITTYRAVNVREFATSQSAQLDSYPANFSVTGVCWTRGERIGSNNIWVATGQRNGHYSYFVAAYYLRGDERGGLAPDDVC